MRRQPRLDDPGELAATFELGIEAVVGLLVNRVPYGPWPQSEQLEKRPEGAQLVVGVRKGDPDRRQVGFAEGHLDPDSF